MSSLPEGILAVPGGRALRAQRDEPIGIDLHIRGGRAVHRLLWEFPLLS